MTQRRDLFPPIEPTRTGQLRLDPRHVMYWEESGNPQGPSVLFLHGGPGAGATPVHRRFFRVSRFFPIHHMARIEPEDRKSVV